MKSVTKSSLDDNTIQMLVKRNFEAVQSVSEIRIELYHVYGSLLFGAEVYRYPKIFGFFQLQLSKFYLRRNLRTLKRLARM